MSKVNNVEELINECGESKVLSMFCEYFMLMSAKADLCDKMISALNHNATSEDLKALIDTYGGDT